MKRFLLDTRVVTELSRPDPHLGVLRQLERHWANCFISSFTLHEIHHATRRLGPTRRRSQLVAFLATLSDIPTLSYDREAALAHSRRLVDLENQGLHISTRAAQIAAIAEVNELILVTPRPEDYRGYPIARENWLID